VIDRGGTFLAVVFLDEPEEPFPCEHQYYFLDTHITKKLPRLLLRQVHLQELMCYQCCFAGGTVAGRSAAREG